MKNCKICESEQHTAFYCYKKTRKPIKSNKRIKQQGKAHAKWIKARKKWLENNPPTYNGYYTCAGCGQPVRIDEVTLDHIKRRGSHPELRYEQSNLQPMCLPCNTIKG